MSISKITHIAIARALKDIGIDRPEDRRVLIT